jgi:hypothetical protein
VTAPVCSRCGVTVRWLDGFPHPENGVPEGWSREPPDGALRCLKCRREVASRQAQGEAKAKGHSGWRARQAGIVAVVALELERTPGASDAEIFSRLNLGAAIMVRKARKAIEAHRERETPCEASPRTRHRGDARGPSDAHLRVRIAGHEEAG